MIDKLRLKKALRQFIQSFLFLREIKCGNGHNVNQRQPILQHRKARFWRIYRFSSRLKELWSPLREMRPTGFYLSKMSGGMAFGLILDILEALVPTW